MDKMIVYSLNHSDGHSPQHYINKPEVIRKITIKVSI